MSEEAKLRETMCRFGDMLYRRGLAHGSSGNISAVLDDGFLVTPTNSCMGMLDPVQISKVGFDGGHRAGDPPSKESFFHLAVYAERPTARGIVHLHSTHSVAISCMCHDDPTDVLPPLTAYHVMRIGRLPLVPYFRPGDRALAEAVRAIAREHHAMLLANHGPVVAGRSLQDAVFNAEELEETAKLHLLLQGQKARYLTPQQISELQTHFPS